MANKSLKKTHKFYLLEKSFFLNFLKKTRLTYYPRHVNIFKNITLFKSKRVGLFNTAITLFVIKATFKQIMQITQFKGLLVVGGLNNEFLNIGKKLFYTFDQWQPGFITNFVKLMRHTLINSRFKKKNTNLLPMRIVKMRRILQIPSYNFSLTLQHYQLNEGKKLNMLQTTVINYCQNINHNFTKILTINDNNSTKNLLVFFIKESILQVKRNLCKSLVKI